MYIGCIRGKGQYICCIVSVADDRIISYYDDSDTDILDNAKHYADEQYNVLNQTFTLYSDMNILKAKVCVLYKRSFKYVYSTDCFYLLTD